MAEIQKDTFQVHKETSACMANLERLDSMKTKLQVKYFSEAFSECDENLNNKQIDDIFRSPKKVYKNLMVGVV